MSNNDSMYGKDKEAAYLLGRGDAMARVLDLLNLEVRCLEDQLDHDVNALKAMKHLQNRVTKLGV